MSSTSLAAAVAQSLLAVEVPYWGQSLLRVLGGIVAVLLPAARSSTSFCSR